MKAVSDLMTRDIVWVRPSTRVSSAVTMMKRQNIGALPVLYADETVVGLVTEHHLLGEPEDTAVMDLMQRDFVAVDPETDVHTAAELMNRTGAGYLLAMDGSKLVGIVSHATILPELGKTFDPLTSLPWSDSFREWALAALKNGTEISVIFFDLDNFGVFNKQFGHVVGDTVLKEVAEVLRSGIDNETDFVCRYGGDEFVIACARQADSARGLADSLREAISRIRIDSLPSNVTGTYGISGGRRSREREDIHFAATIDDLVTRASKNCTTNKPHKAEEAAPAAPTQAAAAPVAETPAPVPVPPAAAAPPATPAPAPLAADGSPRAPRLKIQTITISTTGPEATVGVSLVRNGSEFKREVSGYVMGGTNILRLVAEATAGAACRALAPEHGIVIDEVLIRSGGDEGEVVTVVANFISPRWTVRHIGGAIVRRGDQHRAAAAALLASVNRLLENSPQADDVE